MVKKKVKNKIEENKVLTKKHHKKSSVKKFSKKKTPSPKNFPTLNLKTEHDIASDFAVKVYQKFDKIIKSAILFGSVAKKDSMVGSDIDIIFVIDDVTIAWDQELIAWYREEMEKIVRANPYAKSLHINTIKLSTWWEDLIRGDPVIINIIRYGESLMDLAGFFDPIKGLLVRGQIKSTPEAIYTALRRAPGHIARSKRAELNAIEGLYWSMVDSAHAALIAANVSPPSPEHIPMELKNNFVDSKKLNQKYIVWFRDLLVLHKDITHGKIHDLKGIEIDSWQQRAEEFLSVMADLVKDLIEK